MSLIAYGRTTVVDAAGGAAAEGTGAGAGAAALGAGVAPGFGVGGVAGAGRGAWLRHWNFVPPLTFDHGKSSTALSGSIVAGVFGSALSRFSAGTRRLTMPRYAGDAFGVAVRGDGSCACKYAGPTTVKQITLASKGMVRCIRVILSVLAMSMSEKWREIICGSNTPGNEIDFA